MARTGRPPIDNPHSVARHVRFTADEDATVRDAAERAGLTIGEWMRARLVAAAKRQR